MILTSMIFCVQMLLLIHLQWPLHISLLFCLSLLVQESPTGFIRAATLFQNFVPIARVGVKAYPLLISGQFYATLPQQTLQLESSCGDFSFSDHLLCAVDPLQLWYEFARILMYFSIVASLFRKPYVSRYIIGFLVIVFGVV